MATAELKSSLEKFVTFARALTGDEKSEAQSFLDHFFRALGRGGVIEAGATFEFRVARKPGSAQLELKVGMPLRGVRQGEGRLGAARPSTDPRDSLPPPRSSLPRGGKKFADLLWPDRVLIEMKSRGENLEKHYDQAFDYWTHIVPKRPPDVILCNFDQFWIYDFNTQLFDPVDRISLRDLAENWSAFGFLLPHPREPVFDNNRVAVTRKAADLLAHVFKELVFRNVPRDRAQRFLLPGSARVSRAGEGVPPSRTSTDVESEGRVEPAIVAAESSSPRDAATSTRAARATRTFRLAFQRGDAKDSPWEVFEVPAINSSLSVGVDVTAAGSLLANTKPQRCDAGEWASKRRLANGRAVGVPGFAFWTSRRDVLT